MEKDFLAIGGVTRKICGEEAFFIEKARGEHSNEGRDQQQRPKRAERKWNCEEKDERTQVHGMTDEGVESRGDDLLVFFNFYCRGGVRVGAKNAEYDEHGEGNADIAEDHDRGGDRRPAKAVIESR